MKKAFVLICACLIFVGCGYKPSSYYAKKSLGDSVYAKVQMLRSDPENTIIIKDAVNEALIAKLKSRLASEDKAETKLLINVSAVDFTPIQYDQNGYVSLYRAKVTLNTSVYGKNGVKSFATFGSYEFPIEPQTTVSDSKRFEAIKNGAAKALDMLISQISVLGALNETGTDSR